MTAASGAGRPGAEALLRIALDHAGRGWPVFPLLPRGKRPALHREERCRGVGACVVRHLTWEERATTDPTRITGAWTSGRAFNVGIPTGRAGLLVIDLDTIDPDDPDDIAPKQWSDRGISDGAGVLAALAADAGHTVPATFTVTTPSGGMHLYYRAPVGEGAPALRNTAGDRGRGLGWKIDTRAHGGYVVAPGSYIPAGAYRVTDDRAPVPLPGWILDRLRPPVLPPAPAGSIRTAQGRVARYLHAAITAETARVHTAPAGQRNACLYVAAVALGQLVAAGSLAEHHARGALLDAAGRHLAVGAYSPHQAEQTITSGLRAGAKRPRTITDREPPARAIGDIA